MNLLASIEKDFISRKRKRSKKPWDDLHLEELHKQKMELVNVYEKWKKDRKGSLLELCKGFKAFPEYQSLLYSLEQTNKLVNCKNPQLKPMTPMLVCQSCGCHIPSKAALKSWANDAAEKGKTSGASYNKAIFEREVALTHGVITKDEFTEKSLRSFILNSHRKSKRDLSSDIGADLSGQDTKKGTIKSSGGFTKPTTPEDLVVGSLVQYKRGKKIREGEILGVHVAPSFKNYMVEVGDITDAKKTWVNPSAIKIATENKAEEKETVRQVSIFGGSLEQEEELFDGVATYVGFHG